MIMIKLHMEGQLSLDIGTKFDTVIIAKDQTQIKNNTWNIHDIGVKRVVELDRPAEGNDCAKENDARLEDCFRQHFVKVLGCVLPWNKHKNKEINGRE